MSNINMMRLNNLKTLSARYETKAKGETQEKVKNLIKLFAEQKIKSVKQVENVLEDLTSRHKATVNIGESGYKRLMKKYANVGSPAEKKKRLLEELELHKRKNHAVFKMQHMFRRALVFDVSKAETAMNGKVIDVSLTCKLIGPVMAFDMESILARAYMKAIRQLPFGSKFTFHTRIRFHSNKGDDFHATSSNFNSNEQGKWLQDFVNRIKTLIQSNETVRLSNFKVDFHFILQPSGGLYKGTQSRERKNILEKHSVIQVKINDKNCFWHALAVSMHKDNKLIKNFQRSGPRLKLAQQLCEQPH